MWLWPRRLIVNKKSLITSWAEGVRKIIARFGCRAHILGWACHFLRHCNLAGCVVWKEQYTLPYLSWHAHFRWAFSAIFRGSGYTLCNFFRTFPLTLYLIHQTIFGYLQQWRLRLSHGSNANAGGSVGPIKCYCLIRKLVDWTAGALHRQHSIDPCKMLHDLTGLSDNRAALKWALLGLSTVLPQLSSITISETVHNATQVSHLPFGFTAVWPEWRGARRSKASWAAATNTASTVTSRAGRQW